MPFNSTVSFNKCVQKLVILKKNSAKREKQYRKAYSMSKKFISYSSYKLFSLTILHLLNYFCTFRTIKKHTNTKETKHHSQEQQEPTHNNIQQNKVTSLT